MSFKPPERFSIAEYFLDDRIAEGLGDRPALLTAERAWTYREVQHLANRFGNLFREAGVRPEERVLIALPDGAEYVGALFGTLKIGAVVVMVNPELRADAVEYFLEYTRASALVVDESAAPEFARAAQGARHLRTVFVAGTPSFASRLAAASPKLENFPSHRDDAAIWLFSGGTTGRPKAVVQTHRSFANTTECYAKGVLRYSADDITLSVPKLYFGYATGSNLFFPFAVGARAVLFPEPATPEALFACIARFHPTILVNVPTMIHRMLSHPDAARQDLSCLRLATSAGEALPVELYRRWMDAFGVELLDGLGTAEMWHIFLTNRPGDVRPGTLGKAVPGFDLRICDDEGREVDVGEIGWLRVRGDSRALGYWQQLDKTGEAFQGEWYVTGDMVLRDADGYFTYCGRGDDMLKVSGKWLSPKEVESCLLRHPAVREAAVVGVADAAGLTKPHAFVVATEEGRPELGEELKSFVRDQLEPYKYPREVRFLREFPRTHLGKIDRGKLRALAGSAEKLA
jgi:benzoate-CoA ligase family protein